MPSEEYTRAERAYESRDFLAAVEILTRLTAQGDHDAENLLGKMYLYGRGVEQSVDTGLSLLKTATSNGSYDSALLLAQCFDPSPIYDKWRELTGIQADKHVSNQYWQLLFANALKAADFHDIKAMKLLGGLFFDPGPGNAEFGPGGVQTDASRAIELYEKCYRAGDGDAAINLRDIHILIGNRTEALTWHAAAIEFGCDAGEPPAFN